VQSFYQYNRYLLEMSRLKRFHLIFIISFIIIQTILALLYMTKTVDLTFWLITVALTSVSLPMIFLYREEGAEG